MNKEEIYKKYQSKEDRLLVSSVLDKYLKYEKTGIGTYTNFLDFRMLELIENLLKYLKIKYNVYKPNEASEKSIIYFGNYEDYVSIYKIFVTDIKHSDILGTLFSIGFDIDTIGDIFVEDECIYISNLTRLNKALESGLYTVKNKKVKLEKVTEMILLKERFTIINITVPSYRLDVIVGKLAHLSRDESTKYVEDGKVLLNYIISNNKNKIVKIGDVISIRKVGKFILNDELFKSKKDNFVLEVKKYI